MSELLSQLQQLGDGEIDDLSIAHDASEEIVALRLRVAELVEALEWYSEQVLGCRKTTSEGDQYRTALDRDGGARARAALAAHRKQEAGYD